MASDHTESELKKQKQFRRANPTAWLELTDSQTGPLIVDALLETPPGKEFNKTELGEHAGVSRESVRSHIETLVKFDILEEVPNTSPQRYRLDTQSVVVMELFELNSAMNEAASNGDTQVKSESTEGKKSLSMDLSPKGMNIDLGGA